MKNKLFILLTLCVLLALSLIACEIPGYGDPEENSQTEEQTGASETTGNTDQIEGDTTQTESATEETQTENTTTDSTQTESTSTDSTQTENYTESSSETETADSDTTTKETESSEEEVSESVEETDKITEEETTFDYFNANMSDYMTFEDGDYDSVDIEISKDYLIDSEDVSAYIENQLFENRIKLNYGATYTNKPVSLIDSAFIYYKGYLDGVAFSGGSNWDNDAPYELVIGSGNFIPGFEEALIGMIPEKTSKDNPTRITVTFPENYQSTELAGKETTFEIWIVYTIQYELPEYNESFITDVLKFEAEGDDVIAEYEAYVLNLLEENIASDKADAIQSAMLKALIEKASVLKYPEGEVEYIFGQYLSELEYYMTLYGYYGYTFDSLGDFTIWYLGLDEDADWEAELTEMAQYYVKQYMVYYTVAHLEGFSVTEEEYAQRLAYYVELYKDQGYTAEQLEAEIGANYIKEDVLFGKVDDFLREKINISYEE